jgi:hypothetical protein
MSTRVVIYRLTVCIALWYLYGCVKPEQCPIVSTTYGSVTPFIEYFVSYRITGNVLCESGDKQSRGFEIFPRLSDCPKDHESDDYHDIEMEINTACINHFHLQQQVARWLITDIFGSAYVVKKDFSVSADCRKDSIDISLDASIHGDLRRVVNDSLSYVELKLETIRYSDESFADRKILAVLEPVWDFVARTLPSSPSSSIEPPSLTIDVSGSSGKRLLVETSRHKSVTVDVHNTDAGFLIVELVQSPPRTPPIQSSECTDCMDKYNHMPPSHCLDVVLTNDCGAILNRECAADWGKLKTACPQCQVPL